MRLLVADGECLRLDRSAHHLEDGRTESNVLSLPIYTNSQLAPELALQPFQPCNICQKQLFHDNEMLFNV